MLSFIYNKGWYEVNDISVFLNSIKPIVEDIDKVKLYLDQSNKEYDELDDLINYVGDDEKRLINYKNQDLIYKYLDMISVNSSTYDAIKYLIANSDDSIKGLPQYIKASKNLNTIFGFLNDRKGDIAERVDVLSFAYTEKYIAKKYYEMFSNDNVYVIDPMEFTNFIKRLDITDELRVEVLKNTILDNLNHYDGKEVEVKRNVLKTYGHYLTNKYTSMLDNASKYIDLSLDIDKLLELDQKDYTKESLVLLKRIWFINEINNTNNEDKIKELIDELHLLVRYDE